MDAVSPSTATVSTSEPAMIPPFPVGGPNAAAQQLQSLKFTTNQLEREITFRDAEITRLRKADVNSRAAFARRSLGLDTLVVLAEWILRRWSSSTVNVNSHLEGEDDSAAPAASSACLDIAPGLHVTEAAGDVAAGQQGRASPRFGPPKIAVRGTLKSVQAANQTGSVLPPLARQQTPRHGFSGTSMAEQRITLESSSSDEASSEASAGSHTTTSSLSFGPPKIAVRGTLKSVQAANQTGSVQASLRGAAHSPPARPQTPRHGFSGTSMAEQRITLESSSSDEVGSEASAGSHSTMSSLSLSSDDAPSTSSARSPHTALNGHRPALKASGAAVRFTAAGKSAPSSSACAAQLARGPAGGSTRLPSACLATVSATIQQRPSSSARASTTRPAHIRAHMQSGTHSRTRASKAATLSPPKATVASVLQSAFATWQATAQQQRHQGLLRQAELLRKARLAQAWSQMARDRQLVRGCFQSWQDQAARQKEADSVLLAQAVTG
ncbi:TPA: hypothetical protein ACH3X3_008768 [Trebouxia sp. C0006]